MPSGATGRKALRTIAPAGDGRAVVVLDQTRLPHEVAWRRLESEEDAADAIRAMVVRGAPLIGVTAAFGLAFALRRDPSDAGLDAARARLLATRPTAVNLAWALDEVTAAVRAVPAARRAGAAWERAARLMESDAATNRAIGEHGAALLRDAWERKGRRGRVEVLTHCNAGALATVEGGTALAPVYRAAAEGVPVHVWVDETRPRSQGARLTAWELREHGVPHTLVADVAAASLLRAGSVDLVVVGADRVSRAGDVANKVGTYGVALAAREAGVPFVVAAPTSTVDPSALGPADLPIEERDGREVTHVEGVLEDGRRASVRVAPEGTAAWNPAFDVTPAALVTAIVTEHGRSAPADLARAVGLPAAAPRAARPTSERGLRESVVAAARAMNALGVNRGTSGNVSARTEDGFVVTPSGVRYETMRADDLVALTRDGSRAQAGTPSTEWPLHLAIYRARPDAKAVVHAHPTAATAVSCLRRGIPAFHYMVAAAGGTSIECARYETFGTEALARAAVEALGDRRACLLANHGIVAIGRSVDAALALAVEVEGLAAQYLAALAVGEPVLLSGAQMADVLERFSTYGPFASDPSAR